MTKEVPAPVSSEPIMQKVFAKRQIQLSGSLNHSLLLKVNTLNLQKQIKGILVHNGYFFVQDVMRHFQRGVKSIDQISDIKSDPKLDEEQVKSL